MSSFTTPLIVSPKPDGRKWRLWKEFTFHLGSEYSSRYIHVAAGFTSDFASIPKFLFFMPYWAKFNKAAIIHDWLYYSKQVMGESISRRQADDIFLEAMLVAFRQHKAGEFIARLEYRAVRLFAWLAWKKK